jgi:hypothetical protein
MADQKRSPGPSISLELIVNAINQLEERVRNLPGSDGKDAYLRLLAALKDLLAALCPASGARQYIPFNLPE